MTSPQRATMVTAAAPQHVALALIFAARAPDLKPHLAGVFVPRMQDHARRTVVFLT